MDFRTITSTWYEVVMVGGYGCKLPGLYNSKREAQKAIKVSNEKAVQQGYEEDKYFIMMCSCVRMIEDNGDVVSETIARVRV